MFPRLLAPPKNSFFLLGMRGTGKSSWVRSAFQDATTVDLLRESEYHKYLVNSDLFAERLAALPRDSWVVVDEIQRLPQLLNEVHRAIEEHGLKFALLGSSARKLRRAGTNLLGGRALLRTMYPLLPQEMGSAFSLEHALQFGTLPLIQMSPDPAEQLQAYVQLYLKEEIQAEALVRNLPGFARFLPIASLFHGQCIHVSSLSRDAGIARTTAEGYLQILEDTLLCFTIPALKLRLRVKERVHPKWYWFDNGVARAARGASGVPTAEERGSLFEGLLAMLLRAMKDLRLLEYDSLSYWSPPGGSTEVDFVLQKGKQYVAIESKVARDPDNEHMKGLRAIAELPGLQRKMVVYPGRHDRKTRDGIEVLGFDSFVRSLPELFGR